MININCQVIPHAKIDSIEKIGINSFKIKTTAPATDNQANLAVIKMLAKHLKIKKSCLYLKAGQKSKQKILEIIC